MKFKDKVIWITGASSGIGEALTYAFANEGAKLAISSRRVEELERVKQNCPKDTPILIVPLDVTQTEKLPVIAGQIYKEYGYISMLVANAGISHRALARETDLSVDRKIMEVDYFGTIGVTKATLPYFLNNQFGQIVVISSVMGKIGTPYRSAYAAAKHALHGFFESLRAEVFSENIKITMICPGFVTTNVTINALKGDGSTFDQMADQTAAGMHPDVFAKKALRAIAKERQEVLIGGKETFTVYLQRFIPSLLRILVRRLKVT